MIGISPMTFLSAATAAGAAGPLVRPARAQGTAVWRFAHPHPTSDSWHKAALRFSELIKERSKGAVEVQVSGRE